MHHALLLVDLLAVPRVAKMFCARAGSQLSCMMSTFCYVFKKPCLTGGFVWFHCLAFALCLHSRISYTTRSGLFRLTSCLELHVPSITWFLHLPSLPMFSLWRAVDFLLCFIQQAAFTIPLTDHHLPFSLSLVSHPCFGDFLLQRWRDLNSSCCHRFLVHTSSRRQFLSPSSETRPLSALPKLQSQFLVANLSKHVSMARDSFHHKGVSRCVCHSVLFPASPSS